LRQKAQIDFEIEGVVRSYDAGAGYGFITPVPGGPTDDIFVDKGCVKKSGLEYLKQGARVRCRGTFRPEKNPKAKQIEVISS